MNRPSLNVPHSFTFVGTCEYGQQWLVSLGKGEELRVLKSFDPVPGEGLLLHVSASVGLFNQEGATRRPTDAEFRRVKEAFFPNNIPKSEELPNEGQNPYVRHWWEKQ